MPSNEHVHPTFAAILTVWVQHAAEQVRPADQPPTQWCVFCGRKPQANEAKGCCQDCDD